MPDAGTGGPAPSGRAMVAAPAIPPPATGTSSATPSATTPSTTVERRAARLGPRTIEDPPVDGADAEHVFRPHAADNQVTPAGSRVRRLNRRELCSSPPSLWLLDQ